MHEESYVSQTERDRLYLESQQNPNYLTLGIFYPSYQKFAGDLTDLIPKGLKFKINPACNCIVQDFSWIENIQLENESCSLNGDANIPLRKMALKLILSAIFVYSGSKHHLWFQKHIYLNVASQDTILKLQYFFEDLGTIRNAHPKLGMPYQVQEIAKHVLGISPYPIAFLDTTFMPDNLIKNQPGTMFERFKKI